jgi:hypothetical protein
MANLLAEYLDLNDAQKAAFKEFHEARRTSLEDSKATLRASKPDLSSFEGRLAFSQAFVEMRLAALKAENPKLIAFYNSLDAKQKEKFDRFRERTKSISRGIGITKERIAAEPIRKCSRV